MPSIGERVRVHYNLHTKKFTVSRYIKGRGWIKALSVPSVYIKDVEFKVSEAGRQRAIREGKRNVHAFAYGIFERCARPGTILVGSTQVKYNPFKYDCFVDIFEHPVHAAQEVVFDTTAGTQAWGVVNNAEN